MKLSIIIPVYNEASTVETLLARVREVPIDKEILVVDDGSTDGTREILEGLYGGEGGEAGEVRVHLQPENRGKGRAIRTAIPLTTGGIILIQDADLEYDPSNYPALIQPILDGSAQVVYGTRFHPGNRIGYSKFKIAARLLTWLTNLLYGARITDEATCYKVFRADVLKELPLRCERFEFCPEVTSKVLKRGYRIHEVPISYRPRTEAEGKKISWRDGLEAFYTLFKYWWVD